jgi:hypothetical protein
MPRTDALIGPAGSYRRACACCGAEFRTDEPRTKYCSLSCKAAAANQRYYEAHREEVIRKVIRRRQK